jgi:hypothetical protein
MASDLKRDPDLEWIDLVRPIGLVVAPVLLKELGLAPSRQTQADSAVVAAHIANDASKPAFKNPWAFFEEVLGWEAPYFGGAPGGPDLPEKFYVRLPDHDTTLSPTWAVAELGSGNDPWQLLVRIEAPGIDPDARGVLEGWEATPHQRFERLLRDSDVFAGLLISEKKEVKEGEDHYTPELRVIYAPSGETSGHLTFPLRSLATVAGRPMLGGLKLLLDSVRLFTDADDRRLPALLRKSREAQAAVSTELAEQVLGALHELLRGLDAAEPELIRRLARTQPGHLYEGLLTVLMRLVFILYAEDRDLLPSRLDGRAREIYETSYSVRGLYARLVEDAAVNPDTMDERRGAWGRMLSLFRLIHKGHKSHFVQARGGKLFDPDAFPFLEGRSDVAHAPRVPSISDGCLLRVLEGLMTLKVKGGTRERLSYRALDVEQIGSVYETVMGFTVEIASGRSLAIKAGKHNRTPVFVDLERLAAANGKDRIKFLKEEADRSQLSASVAKVVESSTSPAELAVALDPIVDERGSPKKHEIATGTPILQPTDERRRTGSHYTPRTLTAPIVKYALEPAFERLGPGATPEQILDLKVCDPAMGSGAFLVEACRALAARLVQAWGRHPEKKPVIPPDEDEELHARRLVAQRCLYGVDKNPLATDLAKLSLWLATLARDHEFTFLDHALKSGDSLVGLTQAQIAAAHWDTSKPGLPLFRQLLKDRVAEAVKGRAEIQAAPDDTARATQEQRHRLLEARLKEIRLLGDAVIAAFFAEDKPKAREKKRAEVESWLNGSPVAWDKLVAITAPLKQSVPAMMPLHWQIEYPEVFARNNGGFDAIVGNPPFMGGSLLSRAMGKRTVSWLADAYAPANGKSDLVAFFFRRAFGLIRHGGSLGLIGTKTIRQGFSRFTSLEQIISNGGKIYRAIRRFRWPGEGAAVVVAVVHIAKGFTRYAMLDGREVENITSFLLPVGPNSRPARLSGNIDKVYSGINPNGAGFVFNGTERLELIANCPYCEAFFHPYLSSNDLNGESNSQPTRFIVDVGLLSEEKLRQYPPLYAHLRDTVRIERQKSSERRLREQWWKFSRPAHDLYNRIGDHDRVLAMGRLATHHTFAFQDIRTIFSDALSVFLLDRFSDFTELQCRVHEMWAKFLGSSFKDDPRYIPEDCFETFPLIGSNGSCEDAGRAYYDDRAAVMLRRNEGLTDIYNRFHDPSESAEDIKRLRELHAAMDRAVLEAYGWRDLAARAAPIFLDETSEDDHTYQGRLFWPSDFRDEVLARLLALNAERHSEEVRLGIAPGVKGKAEDEDDDATDDEAARSLNSRGLK